MSGLLRPPPLETLVDWMAEELSAKASLFGIPSALFFRPRGTDRYRSTRHGHPLAAPLGVAAGPHSQLTQNIVAAWLCGARVFELKTVQTRDCVDVARPCIDMRDEGYNIEWSQELPLEESFRQYLHAWILIHALHARLGHPGRSPGAVFDLSIGYDMAGIRQPNMQRFLDLVADPGRLLTAAVDDISKRFPEVREIELPERFADSVTLSTMHGCPPEEIGDICTYLLRSREFHTAVKLNPTLLGAETVRDVLHQRLGFTQLEIADRDFETDLAPHDAVELLTALVDTAAAGGRGFGVKISNTLPVANPGDVFDPEIETAYLSGRPLHALAVNLAHWLREKLPASLPMSFAGGADATNVADLFRCGFETVTACSDLLRPGGYLRLGQYLENLDIAMVAEGAETLDQFVRAGAGPVTTAEAARDALGRYAASVRRLPAFQRSTFDRSRTKTGRSLGHFDCIVAPCTDACSVDQRVPEYMRKVRCGDLAGAAAVIRADNPLGSVLGRACHHPCELVCLRTHMDRPVAIRDVKRLVMDHEGPPHVTAPSRTRTDPVAIIGAGPCGMAAATFLARAGRPVTIFEARDEGGGMVSATIPGYRASLEAIHRDLELLAAYPVEIRYGQQLGRDFTLASLRQAGYGVIVLAVGAQRGRRLALDGENCSGVLDGLDFLRAARRGTAGPVGPRVGVVGGGDVAVDCARCALRLGGENVTVFYRRSRADMPARNDEIRDLLGEGATLVECAVPNSLLTRDGRLQGARFSRVRLGSPDESGRAAPVVIPDETFDHTLDTLIVAIGQEPDLALLGNAKFARSRGGFLEVDSETSETSMPGVFAGGDAAGRGPSTIVEAAGDGRRIAEAILQREKGETHRQRPPEPWPAFDLADLLRRRARLEPRIEAERRAPDKPLTFNEEILTMTLEAGAAEAWRCLDCDLLCSTCEGVCPNRAIITYTAQPFLAAIPQLTYAADSISLASPVPWRIEQAPQVAILADWCNQCGNCVTFCPTRGHPWHDKPRVFWSLDAWRSQPDNAFMLVQRDGLRGICGRFGGTTSELWADRHLTYATPTVLLELEAESLEVREARPSPLAQPGDLVEVDELATLLTLLRSLPQSAPELPWIDVGSL